MNYKEKSVILGSEEIAKILKRLSFEILEKNHDSVDLALVGIQRRGVFLAQRIKNIIDENGKGDIPLGVLDITFYRDDLTLVDSFPVAGETAIDFDITNKTIVIVDDVLFTGRTVRCALDEIMDFGRPKKIQLAVLVDRGHRELPIRADFVGKNIPTSEKEHVEARVFELDGKDEVVLLEEL